MTIFRFSFCLSIPAAFLLVLGARGDAKIYPSSPESCSNIDPMTQRQCIDERVERKKRTLAALYPKALASVQQNFSKYGKYDDRADPKYLIRSQAQWNLFIVNDCNVQAAFGGGSNMSILDRFKACYEDYLDQRIVLLRDLASGTGMFGP